jgi:hypothetical protein
MVPFVRGRKKLEKERLGAERAKNQEENQQAAARNKIAESIPFSPRE